MIMITRLVQPTATLCDQVLLLSVTLNHFVMR